MRTSALLAVVLAALIVVVPSVPSASPSSDRVHTGAASAEDLDGLAVRAGLSNEERHVGKPEPGSARTGPQTAVGSVTRPDSPATDPARTTTARESESETPPRRGGYSGGSTRPSRTTPRAITVPRGEPLTVERDENDVRLAAIEAAREFQIDATAFLCVVRAESGFDMEAAGRDGEVGAFQFLARTFKANGKHLGYWLADITNVVAQARTAAWMWSIGQQDQWHTYSKCAQGEKR